MFDVGWLLRFGAAIAVIGAGPGGVIQATFEAIDEAANVSEWAERGVQFPVDDTARPTSTTYVLPVADTAAASWIDTHSTYPATDIFVGCGATLVAPVSGTVLEVRRVNSYDPAVDNPATRGGRSVAIHGYDGVRYYLAHFETIVDGLELGDAVTAGEVVGTMGRTGRASACHVHFGISPPCPGKEWEVRRGVVWPYPYLAAWRKGEQLSPVAEVEGWVEAHPEACAEAMADPFAVDA